MLVGIGRGMGARGLFLVGDAAAHAERDALEHAVDIRQDVGGGDAHDADADRFEALVATFRQRLVGIVRSIRASLCLLLDRLELIHRLGQLVCDYATGHQHETGFTNLAERFR